MLTIDQLPSMPLPSRPMPRVLRSIDFAALPTAIICTRLFVAATLHLWGAQFRVAEAELLAVELVRPSIQSCGVMDKDVRLYQLDHVNTINVRLFGFDRTISIEVWDNVIEPAELLKHDQDGLSLIDARAKDWGSAITPQGRVTWAELYVYDQSPAGLPIRTPKPTPHPRPPTTAAEPSGQDADLLQQVRDGLQGL